MAISDMIQEAQATLKEIKKKNRFKKANLERAEAVELQVTLAQCRGKLEICRKDLNRSINTQSRNINAGREIGSDTLVQEQILWDSAIGYLLVRDAIYALETINSYDSVSHAYDMLDAAMKQISSKKANFPSRFKIGGTKERNAYGYITSSAALREKERFLESFFEDLKLLGDIEARISEAQRPTAHQVEHRHAKLRSTDAAPAATSDLEARMNQLKSTPDTAPDDDDDFEAKVMAMRDIHPPKQP